MQKITLAKSFKTKGLSKVVVCSLTTGTDAVVKRGVVAKMMEAWEAKATKRAANATGFTLMAVSLAACNDDAAVVVEEEEEVVEEVVTVTPVALELTTDNDILTSAHFTTAADTVTADQDTYEDADVIVEGTSGDGDTLTISTDADITATPTIVGIENIVFNSAQFAGAGDGLDVALDGIASGTVTINHTQVGAADDTATVTGAGGVTVVAGTNVDTLDVTMIEDAATVVDAGSAETVDVTAVGDDQVVTLVLNGDAAGTIDVATDLNISATVASIFTVTAPEELDTITGDSNTTIDVADLSDFDGFTITGAAGVVGAAGAITEDFTGIATTITFDADSSGTVADGATVVIDGTSGTDLILDTDDGDDTTDSEATINVTVNEVATTANSITLDNDGFGDDTITTIDISFLVTQAANAFVIHSDAAEITVNASGSVAVSIDTTDLDGELNASAMTGALTAAAHADLLTITGGSGDDVITAITAAAFDLVGGSGSDTLISAADMTDGTFSGFEVLTFTDSDAFLASQLNGLTIVAQDPSAGTTENINVTGASSVDTQTINLSGITFADVDDGVDMTGALQDTAEILAGAAMTITGSNGADTLIGFAGADTISGGAGADTITGAAGADTLTGGEGADSITGGTGADTIILTETTAAVDVVVYAQGDGSAVDTGTGTFTGFDVITGFTTGSDDIDVSGVLADEGDSQILDQDGASTAALDLADAEYTDQEAVLAFLNDVWTTNGTLDGTDDVSVVAITFSDFTAVYAIDDADDDGVVDTGELELLATVDAILVAADII